MSRQRKMTRVRRDRGLTRRVPMDVVLALIKKRQAQHGLNLRELGRAAGLNPAALGQLSRGRRAYALLGTYEAIRDLPYLAGLERAQLPAGGSLVRQRALAVAGYGVWDVARGLGHHHPCPVEGGARYVFRPKAEKLLAFCAEVIRTPGPSPFAGTYALGRGWRPYDAYDQDSFWDLEWSGNGGLLGRPLRGAELLEEYEFLLRTGVDPKDAVARLGTKEKTIQQALARRAKREMEADDD